MTLKDLYDKAVLALGDNGILSSSKSYQKLDRSRQRLEQEQIDKEYSRLYRRSAKFYLNKLIDNPEVNESVRKNLEVLLLDEPVSFNEPKVHARFEKNGKANISFFYDDEGTIKDFSYNRPKLRGEFYEGKFILSNLSDQAIENWAPTVLVAYKNEIGECSVKTETDKRLDLKSSITLNDTIKYYNRIFKLIKNDWPYEEFFKSRQRKK
ncbi:hypothetical protein KY321_03325 [Candidatus Woesearchaeota archaeon]|nr:hypothetical protein [Candidatus Woesearchaeota archaeon]